VPHRAPHPVAWLERRALEALRPPQAVVVPAGPGDWPLTGTLLEIDGGVELLGLRRTAAGGDLLLLREWNGARVQFGACLAGRPTELGRTDLRGWEPPDRWSHSAELEPWAVEGFLLPELQAARTAPKSGSESVNNPNLW
jgi:hypothetical protein